MAHSDFLAPYLRHAPLFAALVRGVECQLMQAAGPLQAPSLDLGCGDGLFAQIAFDGPFTFGVDPSRDALREASARHAHQLLVRSTAASLPFAAGTLATVVANSVLEHIAGIDAAVAECARVLRPAGRLLITAPSHRFAAMLAGTKLSAAYGRWFNRHSLHHHTDSPDQWRARLAACGFEIAAMREYLDAPAHRAFDLAHYLSVPRLFAKRVTGDWCAFSTPLTQRLAEAWLRPHYERALTSTVGPYLFIDARKH